MSRPKETRGPIVTFVNLALLLPIFLQQFTFNVSEPQTSTTARNNARNYPPVFDATQYIGSITEHSPAGTLVPYMNFTITDADPVLVNNQYVLTLSAFNDVFAVVPSNGSGTTTAAIAVVNASKLNYDAGPRFYSFYVIATKTKVTPQQFSSSAMVNISLIGLNDYPPVFSPTTYNTSISELASPYTSLINLTATDQDYGQFGNASIFYRFVTNTGTNLFRIGKLNGQITVGPCSTPGRLSCIDYERSQSYTLIVLAVDNYGEGFTGTATVNVQIINENDSPPVFTSPQYTGFIYENQTSLNPPPIVINATDDYTNNITYTIVDGDFNHLWTIVPTTHQFQAIRPILYRDTPNSQGFFQLTIQAKDNFTTTVTANITVLVQAMNNFTKTTTANITVSQLTTKAMNNFTTMSIANTTVLIRNVVQSTPGLLTSSTTQQPLVAAPAKMGASTPRLCFVLCVFCTQARYIYQLLLSSF